MNRKVSIIGTVGIPAKYGGFETLAENLVKYLSNKYDITVYCSSKSYDEQLNNYNGAKLRYINLNANGIQSILYDIVSIFDSLKFADVLLILGVSGCIILPFVKLFSRKKIVVNIDGLEWKRNKWGKITQCFLKFSEKLAVKYADMVVSDNKVVQDYIFNEYGVKSVFIAYGGNHVTKEPLSDELKSKYRFLEEKYACTVCRIEPENNIHLILEAFNEYGKLNLVIIGNWSNSNYGRNLMQKYSSAKNIFMLSPIYDQKILNQIRINCFLYIHGHSAGGTNPSLVEAMYLGLPIFAFDAEYNKQTTCYKAKYFRDKDELVELLNSLDENELQKIAVNMRDFALKNYTWEKISQQYAELFSSL
ncbi:MAG: DUF1972 domain-containing protein [Thermoanaerobacterium sp.]|nr:DUF1972 domain-containing protein [Thermoanaerobacterium sp.]